MTMMKGLFKGIKFISQIFVYKEHEMEIGYPTDVKHVAHFGWDDATSGKSPSWMNNFKAGSEFSANTLSNFCQQMEIPPFEDVDQGRDILFRPGSALFADTIPPCSEKSKVPDKVKRKKNKASSPTVPSVSPR